MHTLLGGFTSAPPSARTARRSALLRATVNPRKRVRGVPSFRIPRSYLGLSIEYRDVQVLTGNSGSGPNTVAAQLLANLAQGGGGPPTVRLGGGSTDDAYWNPNHVKPRPAGLSVDIDAQLLEGLADFHRITRSPLILGLNLANSRLSAARDWLAVAHRRLGRAVAAYELGNEPDIYTSRGYGTDSRGRAVRARPRGWGPSNLIPEFKRRARALRSVARVKLGGPGLCCVDAFRRKLPRFLRATRKLIGLATTHSYSGAACKGIKRSNPDFLTARRLLSERKLAAKLTPIATAVAQARHYHKRLRVTEVGSAACGGKLGVSDRYASTVWGADFALAMAFMGARGADFHTSGAYTPLAFGFDIPTKVFHGYAQPLYYGLLFASRALPAGGRTLPVATVGARPRRGANVVLWATIDRHRAVRIVVMNKDFRARGRVRLRVRGGRRRAKLLRLSGPGPRARTKITVAGQSVPSGSTTGKLAGRDRTKRVSRRRGAYSFSMKPLSGAMLVVPTRR